VKTFLSFLFLTVVAFVGAAPLDSKVPVPFVKMDGLGNDFVLINMIDSTLPFDELIKSTPRICDRHFGIGCDGVVLLLPSTEAHFRMRIINSDGSEAEMCGNAIRCAAKLAFEDHIIHDATFTVETLAGIIVPVILFDQSGVITGVQVDMGPPRLQRSEIPMVGPAGRVINEPLKVSSGLTFNITCVNMGNPHTVTFVNDVWAVPLADWGPRIEALPVFPAKTNVEFAHVEKSSAGSYQIVMRVWERGAGITLACGTGACATLVASYLSERLPPIYDSFVDVVLPGGTLHIKWNPIGDEHVYMRGPATTVFRGIFSLPFPK